MTNDINQDTYVKLEQLESMFSEPGYTYLGHGTGRSGNNDQVIDSIFEIFYSTDANTFGEINIKSIPTIIKTYREISEERSENGGPER